MAKLLSDYRSTIRAYLMTAEASEDHWPNTRLDAIINTARRWMQGEILKAFDSQFDVDEDLTAASNKLTLPSLFITEKRLYKGEVATPNNWAPVRIVHATSADQYSPLLAPLTEVPRRETWCLIGNELKPQFVPSVADGTKYVLTYAKQIADFLVGGLGTQSDPVSMSDRFFDGTCFRATELAASLAEEWNVSRYYGAQAMKESETLKSEASKRSLSRDEGIRDVMGYNREEDPWPLADV